MPVTVTGQPRIMSLLSIVYRVCEEVVKSNRLNDVEFDKNSLHGVLLDK